MSKPFAITLAYAYLCELEVESDTALDLAEHNTRSVNQFLSEACNVLRARLSLTDSNNHVKDAKYRRDLYDNICKGFFAYGYCRYWVFKPECMSPFADDINTNIFEGTPRFSECLTRVCPKLLLGFDQSFLYHLDTQVMQYLYTYCFENGVNFRFY